MVLIVLKNEVNELIGVNDKPLDYTLNIKVGKIKAPVKAGDVIGTVEIIDNEGLIIREEEITLKQTIEKASIWDIFKRNLNTLLTGKSFK